MNMDVSEEFTLEQVLGSVSASVMWQSPAGCLCLALRSEFLEELWIRESLALVSAVQLGVFCVDWRSSGLAVFLRWSSEAAEWNLFFDGLARPV